MLVAQEWKEVMQGTEDSLQLQDIDVTVEQIWAPGPRDAVRGRVCPPPEREASVVTVA